MNSGKKIWWCTMLCCMAFFSARASEDSTGTYIMQVLHPSQEGMRSTAIARLAVLEAPASFPFLGAINNNSLYLLGEKAVTTGNRKSASEEVFTVYELYPIHQLLLDKNGVPVQVVITDLQQVEIGRADRLTLSPVADWLGIFNGEVQKRTMAYGQLPTTTDAARISLLSNALKAETNSDALRAGKEAWYKIQLDNATDPAMARLLIDSLTANKGDNATALLWAYAKKKEVREELRLYAQQQAGSLERYYSWLQRIQNLFSGLSLGSILILISLGLSIVYGLAGIINMAHGEFLMIGAYATYSVELIFRNVLHVQSNDWFYIAALPISFVVAGLAGLLLERLVIRRLYARPLESLLATWGISLILIQAARTLFGDLTAVKLPDMLAGGWQVMPHLVLPYNRLFIILLTIIIVIVLYMILFRTRLGMQIRAVTQNRQMSACLGIDTRRIDAITFFIGSGLAGLAGCAMTLIGNVVPDMGQTYIVDSFLVVVTGGVGKLAGTIWAGLGIGIFSKISEAFFEAVYGKVFILLGIMMYMQFKPKGLFPDKGRLAED